MYYLKIYFCIFVDKYFNFMKSPNNIQLSKHFDLYEMCKFAKYGYANLPTDGQVIYNLRQLCLALEVVRNSLRDDIADKDIPLYVNSGYRSDAVNKLVGGVPTSDHLFGYAADIRSLVYPPGQLLERIRSCANLDVIQVGQVILYPTFVHFSINRALHKNEFLKKVGNHYETI